MPTKNMRTFSQWRRNARSTATMLGLLVMATTSNGDTIHDSSGKVPPTISNAPATGSTQLAGSNPEGAYPKPDSVVFKKKASRKKNATCGSKEPGGARKYVFCSKRPHRPTDDAVVMKLSARNNKESAKVRVKVPF